MQKEKINGVKLALMSALLVISTCVCKVPVYALENVMIKDEAGHEIRPEADGTVMVDGGMYFSFSRAEKDLYAKIKEVGGKAKYVPMSSNMLRISENRADITILKLDKDKCTYAPSEEFPYKIRKRFKSGNKAPEAKLLFKNVHGEDGFMYTSEREPEIEVVPKDGVTFASVTDKDGEKLYQIFKKERLKLNAGENRFEAWSEDSRGNRAYAELPLSGKIICDALPPDTPKIKIEGEIILETSKSIIASKPLVIRASSKDEHSGVERYCFVTENGRELETDKLKIMENSAKTLGVYAVDKAGNRSEEFKLGKQIIIDAEGPEINCEIHEGNSGGMAIHVNAEDEFLKVKEIKMMIDGKRIHSEQSSAVKLEIMDDQIAFGEHELVIEASDEAGNMTKKSFLLEKEQTEMPRIDVEGVRSFESTRENVELRALTAADNKVSYEVFYKGAHGPESREIVDGRNFTAKKEGLYMVKATAEDKYENKTSVTRTFVIDRSAPKLVGVEKLDKKYLRNIKFDGAISLLSADISACNTEMFLNNELYDGHMVDKPGHYVLTLKAVDSAGNSSKASAEFIIRNKK